MQGGTDPYAVPDTVGVLTPAVVVTIDDRVADVVDVAVSRQLPGDMPAPVTGGGAITAATGSANVIMPSSASSERVGNPWRPVMGWPPAPGAPVTVDASAVGPVVRQLTGNVDQVTGSFSSRTASVRLVDGIDAITRPVDLALEPGLPIRPSALGILAYCAAVLGYTATAPVSPFTRLFVPLVAGDAFPSVGQMGANSYASGPDVTAPWGVAKTYAGAWPLYVAPAVRYAGSGWPVVTFDFAPSTQDASITVSRAGGAGGAGSSMTFTYHGAADTYDWSIGSGWVNRPLPALSDGSWYRVMLHGTASGTTCVVWDVAAPDGAVTSTSTASTAPTSSTPGWGDWQVKATSVNGTPWLMGVQVRDATTMDPASTADEYMTAPTARYRITPDSPRDYLDACPQIVGRSALEVIQEISTATLCPVWLDEYGVLQIAARGALEQQPISLTLTSTASLYDVTWSSDKQALRHAVRVRYRTPTVQYLAGGSTVWVAPDVTLAPGEKWSQIIHPEDGTDWWGVAPPHVAPSTDLTQQGTDGTPQQTGGAWMTQLDPRSFALSFAGPQWGEPSTNRHAGAAGDPLNGTPTPIIRATKVVTWADAVAAATQTGPTAAADLEHDAGAWGQSGNAATIAAYLAARVTTPSPAVQALDVVPDLRVQLGDVVRVRDDDRTGVILDGLVTGVDIAAGPGTLSQSIALRILRVSAPGALIGDLDDTWTGATLTDLERHWTRATLADLDADPLNR